jgi:hypothetical protein
MRMESLNQKTIRIMKTFKKSDIRAKLVEALDRLDNNDIPSEFSLLSNLDRGRVEYRNNRIWDFDFTITYHKGENIVFFNYKGNEEPQFDWQKQLRLLNKNQ